MELSPSVQTASAEELLPLLYDELRRLAAAKMAREPGPVTIQATELVHEAYLRLLKDGQPQRWNSKAHFYCAAAEAMRRILVERARRRNSQKRGGHVGQEPLIDLPDQPNGDPLDLMVLNDALAKLEQSSAHHAEIVKLRFFAGMTGAQTAALLGRSETTIDNDWAYARAWLRMEVAGGSK
jgi:RNA polymerase sigma factor (TIGR02999 family)